MRAEAQLSGFVDRSKPEFGTWRQHYERGAKKGDRRARKKLRLPSYPDAVEHLVRWTFELFGRDGAHMAGFNLLSNKELESFCRLRRIDLDPLETEALFLLNAVYCNPDSGKDEELKEEKSRERRAPLQRGREVIPV